MTRWGAGIVWGIVGILFAGGVAWASSEGGSPVKSGNAKTGRTLFNGKGACAYCHGEDGYVGRMPPLESDTAALIARLTPPPADLRNASRLELKTDKARAKIIREGHEGTGMFPDTTLTDQEIADIMSYLALLRREGHGKQR